MIGEVSIAQGRNTFVVPVLKYTTQLGAGCAEATWNNKRRIAKVKDADAATPR